ncbi:CLUMA_CG018980, isoform A [Clunio marinus]|uniref:CLUMA_CG018980, isoform A n=1 Tax=Clunio marinus TaxID=568069 RepID=A0A1J1J1S0_9DIPT|nr:CLUMA_CG018980, isoform A [Clunio marinus]
MKALEDKISTKLSKVSKNFDIFNMKVKELDTKVDNKIQQLIDNDNRKRNLIVTGIPAQENESLNNLIKALSSKLGYESSPECRVYRYKGRENNNERPIVIQFSTEFHKQDFFTRYKKIAKTLNLGMFAGFKGKNSRIYLQHDFIKTQYHINKFAIKMLREKKNY